MFKLKPIYKRLYLLLHLQDDDIVVLRDKYPVAMNHILVIPKKHIKNASLFKKDDISLSKISLRMHILI